MIKVIEKLISIIVIIERLFFCLFLATFTLSIRKIINFFPVAGRYNEFTAISIYLSDIFLLITFIFWILNLLCNNYSFLSIFKSICSTWNDFKRILICFIAKLFVPHGTKYSNGYKNVPHGTIISTKNLIVSHGTKSIKKIYTQVIHNYTNLFPLVAALFSFISILWATNKQIALYHSIKISEFILLYFYIKSSFVPHGTKLIKLFHMEQNDGFENEIRSTWNKKTLFAISLIILSVINSLIAILQVILQHSIGLKWLKESVISPTIPGVAKIILDNKAYIRAYGLFPHPNILGAFLLISLMLLISEKDKICSTWNKFKKLSHVFPCGTFIKLILSLITIGIFLSFSKTALIGLILFSYFHFSIVSRGTICNFIFKNYLLIIIFSLIILSFYFYLKPNLNSFFIQSLEERGIGYNVSRETLRISPFFGLGSGQFVAYIGRHLILKDWQYQPVHNVFVLIANENGYIFLAFFVLFLYQVKKEKGGNLFIISSLCFMIFSMIFDHYLWDIQQGSFLLWIIIAL